MAVARMRRHEDLGVLGEPSDEGVGAVQSDVRMQEEDRAAFAAADELDVCAVDVHHVNPP